MSFPNQITDAETQNKKIANMSIRPNSTGIDGSAGLSAADVKAKFDAYPELIKDRLNLLIGCFTELDADGASVIAEAIKTGIGNGDADHTVETLAKFFAAVSDGSLLNYINRKYGEGESAVLKSLTQVLNDLEADGSVTTDRIADGAVTEEKIADEAVTNEKIEDGSVTADKLAAKSVTMGKIDDSAVSSTKIAPSAVTTQKIMDGNVTTPKIADQSVTKEKILPGAVSTDRLANQAVTKVKIAPRSVDFDRLDNEMRSRITGIEGSVSAAQSAAEDAQDSADAAQATADTALDVAHGKTTGYVFETVDALDEWILTHSSSLKVGDSLYIIDTDSPDYWWDGTQKQILETQKPDLTDVIRKSGTIASGHMVYIDASGKAVDAGFSPADIVRKSGERVTGNLMAFDANGNAADAGVAPEDILDIGIIVNEDGLLCIQYKED